MLYEGHTSAIQAKTPLKIYVHVSLLGHHQSQALEKAGRSSCRSQTFLSGGGGPIFLGYLLHLSMQAMQDLVQYGALERSSTRA
jgi:hypothetical protein